MDTGICQKLAFRCPKMSESRNEKTSQNTGFARFGGFLSGFVRIWSEPAGARTQDPNIKSVVLYLLSYGFSGTITAQTVLVVQMYGIYLKMQYPKAFFSCEAPYGSFFRFCPSCHRSGRTLFFLPCRILRHAPRRRPPALRATRHFNTASGYPAF